MADPDVVPAFVLLVLALALLLLLSALVVLDEAG